MKILNLISNNFLPLFLAIFLHIPAFGLHVSVYYYPWYHGINESRVLRYHVDQPPVLGSYRSDSHDVIGRHIEWSEKYGIDNWICSWSGQGSSTDETTRDDVAPLLNESRVTYCLFYETYAMIGLGDVSGGDVSELKDQARYMVREHFNNPSYYKIDGKPVLYVYLARDLTGDFEQGFQGMRDIAIEAGYPDLFIVGDENYWGIVDGNGEIQHSFTNMDRLRIWDAISPYNMHGGGTFNHDGYPLEVGLFEHIMAAFTIDSKVANENGVKFIPGTNPGYNDKAQRGGNYIIPRRVHPDSGHTSTFSHSLDMGLAAMDDTLRAIAINSWNEWYEDSNIEPVEKTGSRSRDGYEYVGYGEDLLQLILDRKIADSLDQMPEYEDTTSLGVPPFPISNGNSLNVFKVDFQVEEVHVYAIDGKLKASLKPENGIVRLDALQGTGWKREKGVHFLQLRGNGKSRTFKLIM